MTMDSPRRASVEREEQYVSLSPSRDSEDDDAARMMSRYELSKKSAVGLESKAKLPAAAPSEMVEFPIPNWEVTTKDLKEALMGDYHGQDEKYMSDDALFLLPSPKALLNKLRKANLRKRREIQVGTYRLWPLLLLSVKAEINPLLTTVEVLCTFLVILTWVQVIFWGGSAVVGGVALFVALSILHYWYGFTRYHSFQQGDWYTNMLTGKALDEKFEQLRDICSNQCHGDTKRRSQTGVVLFTVPFTIFNHVASIASYIVYKLVRLVIKKKKTNNKSSNNQDANIPEESPNLSLMWGVYLANVAFAVTMIWGGPFLMSFAVVSFLINQRLYSAMLFRRNFKGFLSSFVLGDFCIGERATVAITTETGVPVLSKSSSYMLTEEMLFSDQEGDVELGDAKNNKSTNEDLGQMRSDLAEDYDIDESSSTSIEKEFSTTGQKSKAMSPPGTVNPLNTSPQQQRTVTKPDAKPDTKPSSPSKARGIASFAAIVKTASDALREASQRTNHTNDTSSDSSDDGPTLMDENSDTELDTAEENSDTEFDTAGETDNSDTELDSSSTDNDGGSTDGDESSTLAESEALEQMANAPESPIVDFLNDVYICKGDGKSPLDSHPGTLVWKNAIRHAGENFDYAPFGDMQYDWMVKRLGTRKVLIGTIEYGWTELNPIQVREKCKEAYEKQVEVNCEINTILSGLNDLRRDKKSRSSLSEQVEPTPLSATDEEELEAEDMTETAESKETPGKTKRFGKLLRRIGSISKTTRVEVTSTEMAPPTEAQNKEKKDHDTKKQAMTPIYLGHQDNIGYHHFLKLIELAAEDADSEDYTDDIHNWVIPRANAKSFHIQTATGAFQLATKGQVRKHAEECYAEARSKKNLQQLVSDSQEGETIRLTSSREVADIKKSKSKAKKWKKRFLNLTENKKSKAPPPPEATPRSYIVDRVEVIDKSTENAIETKRNTDTLRPETDQDETKKNSVESAEHGKDFLGLEDAFQYIKTAGEKIFSFEEKSPEIEDAVDDTRDAPSSSGREVQKPKFMRLKVFSPGDIESNNKRLEDNEKEDPELVRKWIVQQTKSRRFRSKFFGSLWKRARKLRRKNKWPDSVFDEDGELLPDFSEEEDADDYTSSDDDDDDDDDGDDTVDNNNNNNNNNNDKNPTTMNRRRSSFRMMFRARSTQAEGIQGQGRTTNIDPVVTLDSLTDIDDDDDDNDNGRSTHRDRRHKRKKERSEHSYRASKEEQELSFYDLVMTVLAQDYLSSQTTKDDEDSAGGSTVTSGTFSTIHTRETAPEPKTILEFVERKMEEEGTIFSRMCIGVIGGDGNNSTSAHSSSDAGRDDAAAGPLPCDLGDELWKSAQRCGDLCTSPSACSSSNSTSNSTMDDGAPELLTLDGSSTVMSQSLSEMSSSFITAQ